MTQSNFRDVGDFHEKFGLPTDKDTKPRGLDLATLSFRVGFMVEELAEFCEACGMDTMADALKAEIAKLRTGQHKAGTMGVSQLCTAMDALIDLNYVSLGTAHMMGLPFDRGWDEVQRANMAKERATGAGDARSTRGNALDVVKPEGWKAPDHEPAILAAIKGRR